MGNFAYWADRQALNMWGYMESAEDTADKIAMLYLKASRYLSVDADQIFEKFRTKHSLTREEALRLLNTMQDRTSVEELKRALQASSGGDKAKILAEIESPAYQARLERLQQQQNKLDLLMRQIYEQERDFNTSHYVDLANEAYYKSVFEIQQRAGVTFGFNALDPKAVDQVIGSKWFGKNYSERIWHNTQALAQNLKEELLINLVTGRTEREVAQIIANKFAVGASNARRLIRTESCFLSGEMEALSYKECGITRYRYLATLDLRTSVLCRDLDGKVFTLSKRKVGKNYPPMHPWCRSTTIAEIGEEELAKMQRRARDPVTGKTYLVPANMTYKQWYDEYVKENPDAKLAEKMLENRVSDRELYEKYKAIMPDKVPKTLEEFQKMKYNDSEQWDNLKAQKQDFLNNMNFKDMQSLVGKLGNREVRLWYKAHDEKIPSAVDKSRPLKEQALQAFNMRNTFRTQTRELMKDRETRAELDKSRPNLTFEQLLERKSGKYGLTGDKAYQDIIRSSQTTSKKYDKMSGIKEGE